MEKLKLSEIFVGTDVDDQVVRGISARFPDSEVTPLRDEDLNEFEGSNQNGLQLYLQNYRGDFLTPCPGTCTYICCGYKVLSTVTNCHLGCSYCILQGYYKSQLVTINVNLKDVIRELDRKLVADERIFYRIGTGEFSDSLAYEPVLSFAEFLIPYFSRKRNVLFELKTKTDEVDNLVNQAHGANIMVSWSVAPGKIIREEEKRTASLEARLRAAQRCQEAGYLLGFHFDPIIHYPGWDKDYEDLADMIFSYIDPGKVVWISLGGFRFPVKWKETMVHNYPDSKIFCGEFFPGMDDKMRYLKPVRIKMFQAIYNRLKKIDQNLFIYLCMESDSVWRKAFGWSPGNSVGLSKMLDERSRFMIKLNT